MRAVAIAQPCPEVDSPRQRPAVALVAAHVKRFAAGGGQCGRAAERNLVVRMQPVHVRSMSVRRLRLGIRLEPLLQSSIGADLVRRQPGTLLDQLLPQIVIEAKNLRRAGRVAEQLAEQLHVDRRSQAHVGRFAVGQLEAILGRVRRAGHEPLVLGFLDQVVEGRRATTP